MTDQEITVDVGSARSCNGGAFFRVCVVLTYMARDYKIRSVRGRAYLARDRNGNFTPDGSFGNWLTTDIRDKLTEWTAGAPAALTRITDRIAVAGRDAIRLAMS